jgi:hypothetical protein
LDGNSTFSQWGGIGGGGTADGGSGGGGALVTGIFAVSPGDQLVISIGGGGGSWGVEGGNGWVGVSPVPEPAVASLLLVGLAVVILRRRRVY